MPQLRTCNITILAGYQRPYHKTISNLLLDALRSGVQDVYQATVCSVVVEQESVKNQVRKLIHSGTTDIIITIGEHCSLYAREVLNEVGEFPIIFIGTSHPTTLQLVNSLEAPGVPMSGVIRNPPPPLMLAEKFIGFMPYINSVLIPYTQDAASGYLANQIKEVKRYLTQQGMQVFTETINENKEELLELIESYRGKAKSLIFFEYCFSNTIQPDAAYICWKNEMLFCSSSPGAIDDGACCSLTGELKPLVQAAISIIQKFWEHDAPLEAIPVHVIPDNQIFEVNIDALVKIAIPAEVILQFCKQSGIKVVRRWVSSPK